MDVKLVRQRMGWSQSDLARRLNCSLFDIAVWERGEVSPNGSILSELELISRQAEACCEDILAATVAEDLLKIHDLSQIEISRVKEQIQ